MTSTRITSRANDRYHSLALSSVWNLETIRGASALVLGAGALGNEVAKNLAMMGVRLLIVLDNDHVEASNLTRSVFFRASDSGLPKAQVLATRAGELNPDVARMPLNGRVEEVLGLGVVRRVDMIFSCFDNRLARQHINRMCQKVAKAWVDGSMENLLGDVTVYIPDDGACYECTLSQTDREIIALAKSCKHVALANLAQGRVPTTSTMGSIIAALQVQEALKVLHGVWPANTSSRRIVANCGINDFYSVTPPRRDDCGGHFRFGSIMEMPEWSSDVTTAADILDRYKTDTGCEGHIRLGRDLVTHLTCYGCHLEESLRRPASVITEERARCRKCGAIREPRLVNQIASGSPLASLSLDDVGLPRLDVIQVAGGAESRWYEISGDLKMFPKEFTSNP